VLLDTADTKTINNTNSDVTLITPPGVPGVLDEVVFNTVQNTVSDGENSVVELFTASSGENTRGVGLESVLVSLNGDSNGLLGNSGLELSGASGWDGDERFDTDDTVLVTAGRINTLVWVVSLVVELVSLGVVEGLVLPSTVATHVTVGTGAVNKLLLRKRNKASSSDGVVTLHSTSGGERPAGTALTLILDGGDSRTSPVDLSNISLRQVRSGHVLVGGGVRKHLSVFLTRVIGEVVVSVNGGTFHEVEGLDGSISLQEVDESLMEFLVGSVRFSVLNHELVELGGINLGGGEAKDGSKGE